MQYKNIYISQEGIRKYNNLLSNPKNLFCTSNINDELPIFMDQDDIKNSTPLTLYKFYDDVKKNYAHKICYAYYLHEKK